MLYFVLICSHVYYIYHYYHYMNSFREIREMFHVFKYGISVEKSPSDWLIVAALICVKNSEGKANRSGNVSH